MPFRKVRSHAVITSSPFVSECARTLAARRTSPARLVRWMFALEMLTLTHARVLQYCPQPNLAHGIIWYSWLRSHTLLLCSKSTWINVRGSRHGLCSALQ